MTSSKNPAPNQTLYRDSKTGQTTTKEYAKTHPATTERERVHNPQLPAAPRKK